MLDPGGSKAKIEELKRKLKDARLKLDREKLRTARYGCAGIVAVIVIFVILVLFGVCPGKLP
jgi:hypothetical protein